MERTIEQLLKDLQGLRDEFNDFLYYLPDALLEVDITTRQLTYMNRMAHILFAYSEEDFSRGIEIPQLFAGMEYEHAVAIIQSYISKSLEEKVEYARSGRTDLYEFQMRRKDGSTFPAETQTSFVLNKNYIPIAMRTIVRDITDRKHAEAARVRELQPELRNDDRGRSAMDEVTRNEIDKMILEISRNAEMILAVVPPQTLSWEASQKIAIAARRLDELVTLHPQAR